MAIKTFDDCARCPVLPICSAHIATGQWEHDKGIDPCVVQDGPRTPITLADHAEAWAREHGYAVPPRNTEQWRGMYQDWIGYAFPDGWVKVD
jgi:hypothetical protein